MEISYTQLSIVGRRYVITLPYEGKQSKWRYYALPRTIYQSKVYPICEGCGGAYVPTQLGINKCVLCIKKQKYYEATRQEDYLGGDRTIPSGEESNNNTYERDQITVNIG